jgi:hypothetical protein
MFKKLLVLAFGISALSIQSIHAANLNTGDMLTIDTGLPVFDGNGVQSDVIPGSWFALDENVNGKISGIEKIALSMGTTGLVIGLTTTPGASHSGCPIAGDSSSIDAPWCYYDNTGSDYIEEIPVTGGTTTGLDMRGWSVTWNGASVPFIDKAWGAGFSDGIGNFVWDGSYGHGYTLDFHNRTCFDPSGFCDGPGYALHLEGVVVSVPEASTEGMMLTGLSLLVYGGRRRATTKVARPEYLSCN